MSVPEIYLLQIDLSYYDFINGVDFDWLKPWWMKTDLSILFMKEIPKGGYKGVNEIGMEQNLQYT